MKNLVPFLILIVISACSNSGKYVRTTVYNDGQMFTDESDSVAILEYEDSIKIKKIMPGYYYRKTPIASNDQESAFYNEIDWVYVSDEYNTLFFKTANYEGCITTGINSSLSPKKIYHQLKNHSDLVDDILFPQCRGLLLSPSKILNERIVVLDTLVKDVDLEKDIRVHEKLFFQKRGLVRSIYNYNNDLILLNYKYIGN